MDSAPGESLPLLFRPRQKASTRRTSSLCQMACWDDRLTETDPALSCDWQEIWEEDTVIEAEPSETKLLVVSIVLSIGILLMIGINEFCSVLIPLLSEVETQSSGWTCPSPGLSYPPPRPSSPRWENNREAAGLTEVWPLDLSVALHKGKTVSVLNQLAVHCPCANLESSFSCWESLHAGDLLTWHTQGPHESCARAGGGADLQLFCIAKCRWLYLGSNMQVFHLL